MNLTNKRLRTLATPFSRRTRTVYKRIKTVASRLAVGLALCAPCAVNVDAVVQGRIDSLGVLAFQNQSEARSPQPLTGRIARDLSQKLNLSYKDVFSRQLDAAADASAISAMTLAQLGELGKQYGVAFVVRGGLLGSGDGGAQTQTIVQLYADIVSVDDLNIKSVRAEGHGSDKQEALKAAIDKLAEAIHQGIVSRVV